MLLTEKMQIHLEQNIDQLEKLGIEAEIIRQWFTQNDVSLETYMSFCIFANEYSNSLIDEIF